MKWLLAINYCNFNRNLEEKEKSIKDFEDALEAENYFSELYKTHVNDLKSELQEKASEFSSANKELEKLKTERFFHFISKSLIGYSNHLLLRYNVIQRPHEF